MSRHPASEEERNLRNLVRLVSGLVAWPALSAGLVMLAFDARAHALHVGLFVPFGAAALAVFFLAPRIAGRWVRELDVDGAVARVRARRPRPGSGGPRG